MLDHLEGRRLLSGSGGVDFGLAFGIGSVEPNSALHANAVATDAAGDVYLTGSFRGTVGFDPSSSGSTLATAGAQDSFVAKYTPTGALAWVRTFPGRTTTAPGGAAISAVSQGSAIAVDGTGNVFVAGSFDGTVDFGTGPNLAELATPAATTEAFVAKIDPLGTLTWARAVGGTVGDTDSADALALDGSGVVIAGSFADSASFGPSILIAGGASEAFAARLDGSGNFLWASATAGSAGSNAHVDGVAVDGSGNVALGGFLSGTAGFGSPGSAPLTAAGSDDIALWKLDPNGNLLWDRSFGSADYDAATAVAFDASGDLYATGAFSDSVNFSTGASGDTLTAGPVFDEFALKLGPTGQEAWAKGFVGPGGSSKGQGVAVDAWGNVHLAGTFAGLVDFDPGPASDLLTSGGSTDVSLAGLNPSGNLIYALQAGKSNANTALGVAINPTGQVAIAGDDTGSIAFGPTTLAASGVHEAFGAAIQIPTPPTLAAPQVEPSSVTGSNNTTSIRSPIFDVAGADPGATVELLRNGSVVATRVGPGAIQDPGTGRDGTFAYATIEVNAFGVAGASGPAATLTILATPPSAPASPSLLAADNTGPKGLTVTNNRQFHLVGTATPTETVQLVGPSGSVLGTATAGLDGSYSIAPATPLADGTYPLSVRSVDLANNLGAASPALSVVVLATRPAAPAAPTLNQADVTGAVGSEITSNRSPRVVGKAQPGTTVQILGATGNPLATATVGPDGTYTATLKAPLADGTYAVVAVATDIASNVSPPGPALTFTILTTLPAAPTAQGLLAADDSGVLGDGITNVRQPRLGGKATPGTTVQLLDSTATILATTTAGPDGSFVLATPSRLADGTYAYTARVADGANNLSVGNPSFAFRILATPPAAPSTPSLLAADDSAGPNLTNVRQPRLTGKAPVGTTVQILGATGAFYGYAATGPDGTYVVPIGLPLVDGSYSFHAVALDFAANLSVASGPLSVTILATPPPRPAVPAILAADDTGIRNDGMTADRRPRISGTAKPGTRVDWLAANGSVIASATASSSNGSYTLQAPNAFPNGTIAVTVRATDPAGNVSPVSPALALTIRATVGDFFGDSRTDIGTYRPGNQSFNIQVPTTYALDTQTLGKAGDVPISGDFGGDGRGDLAVYTPSTSTFTWTEAGLGTITVAQWGTSGDIPVPGDYNGVGASDVAIYRPSTSTFDIRSATTYALLSIQLGHPGDLPVPADYLGNGRTDVAVWRPSNGTFYIQDPATNAFRYTQFGAPGDVPVPADYEGIGHADLAVYRPSNFTFYVLMANGSVFSKALGSSGDTPILGDFFGAGHASLALYRSSTSTFTAFDPITGASKTQQWGVGNSDRPLTAALTGGASGGGSAITIGGQGGGGVGGGASGGGISTFIVAGDPAIPTLGSLGPARKASGFAAPAAAPGPDR